MEDVRQYIIENPSQPEPDGASYRGLGVWRYVANIAHGARVVTWVFPA